MMNCWTEVLKDFDSRTEVMGLKCPCGNTEGSNDLVSQGQTLVHIGADPSSHRGIIVCSIGTYTASDSALRKIGSGHSRL